MEAASVAGPLSAQVTVADNADASAIIPQNKDDARARERTSNSIGAMVCGAVVAAYITIARGGGLNRYRDLGGQTTRLRTIDCCIAKILKSSKNV